MDTRASSLTYTYDFPPDSLSSAVRTHVICMPPLQPADRTPFGNTHLLITSLLCSLLFPDRCPCSNAHTSRPADSHIIRYGTLTDSNGIQLKKQRLMHKTNSNIHNQINLTHLQPFSAADRQLMFKISNVFLLY